MVQCEGGCLSGPRREEMGPQNSGQPTPIIEKPLVAYGELSPALGQILSSSVLQVGVSISVPLPRCLITVTLSHATSS